MYSLPLTPSQQPLTPLLPGTPDLSGGDSSLQHSFMYGPPTPSTMPDMLNTTPLLGSTPSPFIFDLNGNIVDSSMGLMDGFQHGGHMAPLSLSGGSSDPNTPLSSSPMLSSHAFISPDLTVSPPSQYLSSSSPSMTSYHTEFIPMANMTMFTPHAVQVNLAQPAATSFKKSSSDVPEVARKRVRTSSDSTRARQPAKAVDRSSKEVQMSEWLKKREELQDSLSTFLTGGPSSSHRSMLLDPIREYLAGKCDLFTFLTRMRMMSLSIPGEVGTSDVYPWLVRQFLSVANILASAETKDSTSRSRKTGEGMAAMLSYLQEHGISPNDMGVDFFEEMNHALMVTEVPFPPSDMHHHHAMEVAPELIDIKQEEVDYDDEEPAEELEFENFTHPSLAMDDSKMKKKKTADVKKKRESTSTGLRSPPNKWTKEESQKLIKLVHQHGERQWKKIAENLGGGKTGAQCAQHWKRVLSPEIRKGSWDDQEEELLFVLVRKHGQSWKNIATEIKTRTDIQCRYQYLKACMSREVHWSYQEDDILVKKVQQLVAEVGSSAKMVEPHTGVAPNIPWVEVAKALARAKITKIPRTALECKHRFTNMPPPHQGGSHIMPSPSQFVPGYTQPPFFPSQPTSMAPSLAVTQSQPQSPQVPHQPSLSHSQSQLQSSPSSHTPSSAQSTSISQSHPQQQYHFHMTQPHTYQQQQQQLQQQQTLAASPALPANSGRKAQHPQQIHYVMVSGQDGQLVMMEPHQAPPHV
eukprot:TRINITY_DN6638_c0_g1_i7.p1 TRINITY_DN6638_c0_g1~~TRINITY_DN6638_c0_g1_i7.p1  ORF type:complete len:749 (-),score=224.75 TRINITY_DN6638_c0_g1_i7:42-2288(-)